MNKKDSKYSLKKYNKKKIGNCLLYELTPDNWVKRGSLPEVKEYKARWHNKNEIKDKERWQHYYWSDPERRKKMLAKKRDLKKAMRRKGIKPEMGYINSEKGYMRGLWNSAKTRCRKTGTLFDLTWEEFWSLWHEQKLNYGMMCPYTKVEMTFIRGLNNGTKTKSFKRVPTNVSIDQIWPGKGYTPHNVLFCTVKANFAKKSITPDMCQAVVDIYNERCRLTMARKLSGVERGDEYHKEQIGKIILNRDGHFTEEEKKSMLEVFYKLSVLEAAEASGDRTRINFAKKDLKDYYRDETQ